MTDLAAQWQVKPDELQRKTAEMINACFYFTGAAQRPEKQVKFDFYYVHCTNSSIFFSAFLKEDWLKVEDKCRLLEWKGRLDLVMYASRRAPELLLDQITGYKVKKPEEGWEGVVARVNKLGDDGHASKLIRALANGEQTCREFEGSADEKDFVIRGDMWLKLGHMVIDSVEGTGPRWARSVGFDQAWENIPDRAKL
jgi:Questin oxidase-like